MLVVVWIAEPGWPAAVDAAGAMASPDAEVVLVHVTGDAAEVVRGAFAGRFVVDHGPCAVLLVRPGPAPGVHTNPPPPQHPPGHPR